MKRTITLLVAIVFTQLAMAQNSVKMTFESAFTFKRIESAYALIVYDNASKELYKTDRSGQLHFDPAEEDFSVIFYSSKHEILESHFSVSDPLEVRVILRPNKLLAHDPNDEDAVINALVLNEASGSPLANAKISIPSINAELSTDNDGKFIIQHDLFISKTLSVKDSFILEISKPGYEPIQQLVSNSKVTTFSKFELKSVVQESTPKSKKIFDSSLEQLIITNNNVSSGSPEFNCSPLPNTIRVGTNCNCNSCSSVAVMALETYVQQGLNDEWIASWMTASLKAGSLPYRTYGAYYIQNPYSSNYDLASSTCKQVWDSDFSSACVSAASSTSGEHLVTSSNTIAFSEYSAENNGLGAPSGQGCGNGYAGTGSSSPCISDNVCSGYSRAGHGRGMCQWGSQRWAQQGQTYEWITDHYYNPANITRCTVGPPPTLDCTNATALTCGITSSNGSSNANSNVSTYGCNNWTETGPERVHTITPTGSGTITATISNFSGDLDVYILGSCDPNDCLGNVFSASASYTGAQAGQTYYIVVDSDDGSGSGYNIVVDCPTPIPCDIPVSPHTDNIDETSAKLDWSVPNGGDDYEIQWREVGSATWNNETATSSYKNVTTLTCNTNYEWRVRTICDGGGFSAWSSIITFTTSSCVCDSPGSPHTDNITETFAKLDWSTPNGGDDYEIQWRVVGSTTWINETSTTSYKEISTFTCNTTYEWRVRTICNAGGFSDWSSIIVFTTSSCPPCAIPGNPLSNAITQTSATLNWSNANGAISYELEWREISASQWNLETSVGTTFSLTGLTCEMTYEWRVRASCNNGVFSGWMNTATFTTNDCGPPGCAIPLSPQTINIDANSATLYWGQPVGETDFESQWREIGTSNWNVEIANDYFENITGLTCPTSYEWKVRTICNSGGYSSWSNIVIFTTDCPTGVDEIDMNDMNIYPNPASDFVRLSSNKYALVNVKMYDMIGKLIEEYENDFSADDLNIDLRKLESGAYTFRFYDQEQLLGIKRLIINN